MPDRTGGWIGNGDKIMALLTKDPTKPWNQVMVREVLKISEEEFEEALSKLTKDKSVTLDPANNSMMPEDRIGSGYGNGYWAGDRGRYEAAVDAVQDRNGSGETDQGNR